MKVIVFTQAYNAEKTLPRAIESILNQTFQNIEYYVLDNGSADHTKDIILDYARRDPRVIPLSIDRNNINHGGLLFWTLCYASDADYSVWLDADDEYDSHFMEEMVDFATDNALDIAACGYDMIDGMTGKLIKSRALEKNLLLAGKEFSDHFIEYRGFTVATWGRLYSLPFIKSRFHKNQIEEYKRGTSRRLILYGDAMYQLELLKDAKRAGVYRKPMYRYYQYPRSLCRQNLKRGLKDKVVYLRIIKRYLEHYGPISKLNEDFLYAIWISLTDESVENIFSADLSIEMKLNLLRLVFKEPLWAETLARDADPQFRNLAARREYVAKMKERILALASTPKEQAMAEAAVRELDKPIAGGTV